MDHIRQIMQVSDVNSQMALFGVEHKHMQLIEKHCDVIISSRGENIEIVGQIDNVNNVTMLIKSLVSLIDKNITINERDIVTALKLLDKNRIDILETLYTQEIGKTVKGDSICAKTFGQRQYVRAISKNDVTFGIGPAGTGKTFLAIVMAVNALRKGEVKKIILTRPAVEAGESLGFLPGDLKEKVDPYLRPVYDALHVVLGVEHTNRLLDREVIEIAPLAYMRGRTLDNAFVILDESQNTTIAQMKMFLTRLGFGSKMVINGDISQIDLGKGIKSGLVDAQLKLEKLNDIRFVIFDSYDVVRHPIVSSIIKAYSHSNEQK